MNTDDPDYAGPLVAYLGPEGTFSHEACRLAVEHLSGQGLVPIAAPVRERPYRTIAAILRDTADARCVGVVPVPNTAVGLFEDSYPSFSSRLACKTQGKAAIGATRIARRQTPRRPAAVEDGTRRPRTTKATTEVK